MTTISFLGPEGTFAHAALRSLPVADGARLLPMTTVTHAIDAVRSGVADAALVPLENSVEGAVPATLDELASGSPLIIAAETYLKVRFAVMGRSDATLAGIRTVATHPHAEAQVRRWLMTTLPNAQVALVGSTAGAASAVAAGEHDAAIGAEVAAELYGLTLLARDIADNDDAVTRFVVLTRPTAPPAPTGNDRTTLVAFLREDHAGALLELLSEFSNRGVNLTRIESRPTKGRFGHYSFSIDCEGHLDDERVGDALAALRRICSDVRYLGSYPRLDGRQGEVLTGRADRDFASARGWLARLRQTGADKPADREG